MLQRKQLFMVFIPAIVLVGFGLFIEVIRYQPTNPAQPPLGASATTIIPVSPDDPVIGANITAHTVIAFEDFGCAACASQTAMLDALRTEHPNALKLVWKGLSVKRAPESSERAQDYGYCAHNQRKFDAWEKTAFANLDALDDASLSNEAQAAGLSMAELNACLSSQAPAIHRSEVEALASQLNIQGTPTFYLDNAPIATPSDMDGWRKILKL